MKNLHWNDVVVKENNQIPWKDEWIKSQPQLKITKKMKHKHTKDLYVIRSYVSF